MNINGSDMLTEGGKKNIATKYFILIFNLNKKKPNPKVLYLSSFIETTAMVKWISHPLVHTVGIGF